MYAINITQTGATAGVAKRELGRIARESYDAIGVLWHQKFRPLHFTHKGATEYGYKPRVGERGNPHKRGFRSSYTGQKLRKYGHTLPLVLTGESRREASIRDVRPTSKGARVVIHARKLNFRPESRLEMIKLTANEMYLMTRHYERTMQEKIKQLDASAGSRRGGTE